VPLPETILVKYTEEEAEYISMRPLVRQTFRAAELVDMIVGVTGKDAGRVQKILAGGTIVFHNFRYWWQGFEADPVALAQILKIYPDAEPSLEFRAESCTEVILESSGSPARHSLRIARNAASKRRLLRALTYWDILMKLARDATPAYREYSYSLRGDVYALPLSADQVSRLVREAVRYATRSVRADLAAMPPSISHIIFICPRKPSSSLPR
jgi:hypothetical protein